MRKREVQVPEVEPGRDEIDVPAALAIGPGGDPVEVEGLAAAIVRAVFVEFTLTPSIGRPSSSRTMPPIDVPRSIASV